MVKNQKKCLVSSTYYFHCLIWDADNFEVHLSKIILLLYYVLDTLALPFNFHLESRVHLKMICALFVNEIIA